MEKTSTSLGAFRTAFAVFACLLILATTAYAANYSNSASVPPGGNPPALVDLSATYAEKTGGFWADSIGTTNGFCIGASCITSWPWVG